MTEPLLRIKSLHTHFNTREGVVRAVDGVDLDIRAGTTVCVVGESGSGKSVTARSILQIVARPGRIVGGSIVLAREGRPAVDIAALSGYGPDFLATFQTVYPVTAATMARIAFYHGTFALQEALVGIEHGDSEAFASGIAMYR